MPTPANPSRPVAVYALTTRGAALGAQLAGRLGATLHLPAPLADRTGTDAEPFDSLPELVGRTFHACRAHLFIAAAGIAVRAVAPHLAGKDTDPAVLVLDQEGEHVIPLLSGHLGGANELARQVAGMLGARAVITTATDTAGVPAVDLLALERGLLIDNLPALKRVNAALVEGVPLQVYDPEDRLGVRESEHFEHLDDPSRWNPYRPGVWVGYRDDAPGADALRLIAPVLHLGVGCRRGVPGPEIEAHLRSVLAENRLAPQAVAGLATIEDKRLEPGIAEAARALGVQVAHFDRQQLDAVAVAAPSRLVREHMGVDSVCEAAAILASNNGRLVVTKTKTERVTCAVAASW